MIVPPYHVADSTIPGAGLGLFVSADLLPGQVVIAPDAIPRVFRWQDVLAMDDPDAAQAASVRWFEDRFTVSTDWPDECYVNHSFDPSGLWHLGFVFARRRLRAGDELTVDYRYLLGDGQVESFRDAGSGEAIVGHAWREGLARSTAELAALLAPPPR
jgi:hypothetical protein